MTPMYESIMAVGRDCDCGHPMIWRRGQQRCAIYGRHEPRQYVWIYRNRDAPLSDVVTAIDDMDMPDCRRTRRADYETREVA